MNAIERPSSRSKTGKLSRQEILNNIRMAAVSEFSLHGFNGASTQSIAERAGMTKSQLHYYIEDKEQLYTAILEQIFVKWAALFSLSEDTQTPAQVIADYVRKKLDFALEEPELSRVFTHELISGGHRLQPFWENAAPWTEKSIGRIQAWVDAGQLRPINPRLLLMHIWAMTQYYADYALQAEHVLGQSLQVPEQRQEILDELVDFVLIGCGLTR
jgi:TetR/AcrR family transcriptional regulator